MFSYDEGQFLPVINIFLSKVQLGCMVAEQGGGCLLMAKIFEVLLMCCNEPEMRGWVITHQLLQCFMWAREACTPLASCTHTCTHTSLKEKELAGYFWMYTKNTNSASTTTHLACTLCLQHWRQSAGWDFNNKADSIHLSNIQPLPPPPREIPGSPSLQLQPAPLHHLHLGDCRPASQQRHLASPRLWNHPVCWPFTPTSAWPWPQPLTTALLCCQVQRCRHGAVSLWVCAHPLYLFFFPMLNLSLSGKYQSVCLNVCIGIDVRMFVFLCIYASPCCLTCYNI